MAPFAPTNTSDQCAERPQPYPRHSPLRTDALLGENGGTLLDPNGNALQQEDLMAKLSTYAFDTATAREVQRLADEGDIRNHVNFDVTWLDGGTDVTT